jgi:hypothetical protein
MNMNDKFCTYCGTPLEENAKFCVGCGSKTDAAPVYAGADAPAPGAPQQTGAYYQMQQEPAPPQAGGYYQQPTAAPGPGGGPYYPPQQPGAGYPNAGYPYAGYPAPMRPKGNRGVLIGVIIGLAVLVAAAVIFFVFLRRPVGKPGVNNTGPSVSSAGAPSQGNNEKPPLASDVKKDAALGDIMGYWEGEIQFTRMEGFDKLPAEDLPENFDEILKDMLTNPAPMTFEIREDGGWELYADVVMGMWFDSDDFEGEEYKSNPLLLTGLKNGAFKVSYSEEIDEDDIKGTATFELSGTVHEDGGGLYMEGVVRISMPFDDTMVLEEATYKVTLTEPADPYETDDWDMSDDGDWEDEDADAGGSAAMDGPSLSTSERPEIGDFSWYWDDVFYSGSPYDAVYTYDFASLKGSWKAFFYYDPYEELDAYGYELLNIAVGGDESNVTLTLDSYKYYYDGDGEEYDTSGSEILTEYGSYDGGILRAGEPGVMIYITDVYYLDGVQYALGYIEIQSGKPFFT